MAESARARAHSCVPERVVNAPAAKASSEEPSVFGFRINTSVPLQFLRNGGGVNPLEILTATEARNEPVGELLGQWSLQGTAYPANATLTQVSDGFEYWTSDAGLFQIDVVRGRIIIPPLEDTLLLEQRLNGMPMILSFVARGDTSLHAAAVEVGSGAVILAAPSRYGKSTLAFAFQRAGHRMLSEDLVCCRPATAEAIPGPALMRIRPDVFDGDLPSGLFVAANRPDRIYVGFDDAARGSSAPVPIKAIVFLREADAPGLERVTPPVALKDLWRLSFRTGTEDARANSFRNISRLAGEIPCWNVYRPLKLTELPSTVELIESLRE